MEQNYPKVGAGVVIVRNGQILLARRAGSHSADSWGTMGGHVDFGETPQEAVKREAREELGIEIGNLKFVSCLNFLREGKHYLDVSFVGEILDGEPTIMEPERISEIGWYPLDDLPAPLFEPLEVVLEALKTGIHYFEIDGR